jgi:hypothetical protein
MASSFSRRLLSFLAAADLCRNPIKSRLFGLSEWQRDSLAHKGYHQPLGRASVVVLWRGISVETARSQCSPRLPSPNLPILFKFIDLMSSRLAISA